MTPLDAPINTARRAPGVGVDLNSSGAATAGIDLSAVQIG
jgi:hypothetical protein